MPAGTGEMVQWGQHLQVGDPALTWWLASTMTPVLENLKPFLAFACIWCTDIHGGKAHIYIRTHTSTLVETPLEEG